MPSKIATLEFVGITFKCYRAILVRLFAFYSLSLRITRFSLFTFVCTFSDSLGAHNQSQLAGDDLLQPANLIVNSLEDGRLLDAKFAGAKGTRVVSLVSENAYAQKPDGDHYFSTELVGGDKTALKTWLSIKRLDVGLLNGRKFILSWQMRTDGKSPLEFVNSSLFLSLNGERVKTLVARPVKLRPNEWQKISHDFYLCRRHFVVNLRICGFRCFYHRHKHCSHNFDDDSARNEEEIR